MTIVLQMFYKTENKDMKKFENIREKIKKTPYRGVLTEIAKEQGVTRQAIWDAAFKCKNPRILTILALKMKQRKINYTKIENDLQAI